MRKVLVTGANKGIGFAIAQRILEEPDTFVYLGARDRARGDAAVAEIVKAGADPERVRLLEIDVSDDTSVQNAAELLRGESLFGLVNNAGIGLGSSGLEDILNVNVRGIHRVCSAFIPLLHGDGRVVNVTSAAGPMFVVACDEEMQKFFTNPAVTWEEIDALMKRSLAIEGDADAFSARGLGNGQAYGLSKACANALTLHLAREHPALLINACTPGFIATDLTRQYEEGQGKSLEEMGAKTPREGAASTLFLLFDQPQGSGHYYGSDAKRSPLDQYREPGTPAYTGE